MLLYGKLSADTVNVNLCKLIYFINNEEDISNKIKNLVKLIRKTN